MAKAKKIVKSAKKSAPKKVTKKVPLKKEAARPVKPGESIEELVSWFSAGMTKVKERLTAEMNAEVRDTRPASELAHLYGVVRDMSAIAADALTPLANAGSTLGNVLVPKAFENENLTSFTTKDGYRVTVSLAYRVSMKTDKKPEAYAWLVDNGLDALITQTVNASTLAAALRKRMDDEGKEPPEELFNAAYMPTTSLTKTKK